MLMDEMTRKRISALDSWKTIENMDTERYGHGADSGSLRLSLEYSGWDKDKHLRCWIRVVIV